MLRNARLVAFAATADPRRAKAFYQKLLGLTLLSDDGFALAFDCNGTRLRIQKVEAVTPPPFTVLGWQVDDIQRAVATLSSAQIAWFKDPDGNLLSLAEHGGARGR